MRPRPFIALLAFLLPLIFVSTACSHKPNEKIRRTPVIVVDNKERGWLGVSIDEITPKLVRRKNLKVEEGVYVTNVEDDGPADVAGMRKGDIIVEFDGKKISDDDDLISNVRDTKPGTEVSVGIVRDGDKRNLKVTIDEIPSRHNFSFMTPPVPRIHVAPRITLAHQSGMYGLALEELNKQLGEYFGAPNGRGVLVKNVKRNSEAEKAGFKAGDVIVKIGKETIADMDDLHDVVNDFENGDKAEFEILRKGATQKLMLEIEEHDRWQSFGPLEGDEDALIDILPPDEGVRFHFDADELKHELDNLKRSLKSEMRDLKFKLKHKFDSVRNGVNI
jgi:predicted metalloprotease with PDZ domain